MATKMSNWAKGDRPREKMAVHGAQTLSKAELLAILLGSGTVGENVVELTQRLLMDYDNNLHRLARLSLKQLQEYRGIGEAKAVKLMAAFQLARLYDVEKLPEREPMTDIEIVARYCRSLFADSNDEQCWVLLLDTHLRLIDSKLVSKGGVAYAAVDIRSVMKEALLAGATAIIVTHNHPSGSTTPSMHDHDLTRQIGNACNTLKIKLIDHIIVGDGYYSYHDNGRL